MSSKSGKTDEKAIQKIYHEKRNLCESQNYYMKRFIRNKQWSFRILRNEGITLNYTSQFDELKRDIYLLSTKHGFYINDIYRLFIKDPRHLKLTLEDYHCLYLKKEYDIIGYILFTTSDKEIIIQFLLIDPSYRGKSLGSFLVNAVEICVHYLRDVGLLKYKNGIISAYTHSPVMGHILEKHNFIKQETHSNPNIQDHDYFLKSFL
jgi:GNAT superfamily N-acetyltransferase